MPRMKLRSSGRPRPEPVEKAMIASLQRLKSSWRSGSTPSSSAMIVTGRGDREVADHVEGLPALEPGDAGRRDLAGARLPGADAARREAAVHDGAQGLVAGRVGGDQVRRALEREGVDAGARQELREGEELAPEGPAALRVVQHRHHRLRREELGLAQHEDHVLVARDAEAAGLGRPVDGVAVAERPVGGVGVPPPGGSERLVLDAHAASGCPGAAPSDRRLGGRG
jgi:hypothetical protein